MIRARGRLALPALLLAALAALFAILSAMPWSAHAQTAPTLQVEDVSASERAGALEFTVSLADGATATEAVTVDYATADGDALAGNDYTGTSGTLTIPSGESSGIISVPIIDDDVAEDDETFTLTLSNPSNAALPGSASSVAVIGTIADDEKPRVTITLRQDEVFVGQPAVFDFTRAGSATDRLLIPFRVSIVDLDNVVIPSALYDNWSPSFITPNVVIPANETSVEWSWHPEDGIGEDYLVHLSPYQGSDLFDVDVDLGESQIDESFFTLTVRQRPRHQSLETSAPDGGLPAITITAVSGGEDGVPTVAEGDDATFTLTRTGDTTEALTVDVRTEEPYHPDWTPDAANNPSELFHDVTFATGTATTTLTVPIDDDDVPETADWLEAHISPSAGGDYSRGDPYRASVNIIDESVDHSSLSDLVEVGIVAVTASVDEGGQVRVNTQRPALPYDGQDYPPLNVKVHVSQDGAGIPEDRTGVIVSVHPRYAHHGINRLAFPTLAQDGREPPTTVTFTMLESPEYRIDPDRASVTVTVHDQDPEPVLEIADATAHGGAASIDFQVSFADGLPSYQTVTVDYRTSGISATAGQDYEGTSGTLIILPGETAGVISVPLLETARGQDETMLLILSGPSNATLPSDPDQRLATGTLDYLPIITLEALQSEAVEGEDARFKLTRSGVATSDLTVTVNTREPNHPHTNEDDGNPTEVDRRVTFLAGSNTAILEVPTSNDGVEETERDYLEASIATSSSEYRLGTTTRAEVEVFDSVPVVTIDTDQDTIVESDIPEAGSKEATFTLTRQGGIGTWELTVTVRVDDPEMIRCFDHVFWKTNCPGSRATFEEEVTFPEGSATTTLSVPIFNDWRDVPDDSALTVTVIDRSGYRPGDQDSATVTLIDDDITSILVLTTSHAEITEGEDLVCSVVRFGGIFEYREQFDLEVTGTGRGRNVDLGGLIELDANTNRYDVTIELPEEARSEPAAGESAGVQPGLQCRRGHLGLGEREPAIVRTGEATGNLCLGSREAVQQRVSRFLAGLAGRKEEVRRRCRTALQSRAEALYGSASVPGTQDLPVALCRRSVDSPARAA